LLIHPVSASTAAGSVTGWHRSWGRYGQGVVVRRLWVRGYRSLRDISLPLDGLTVIRGANASGKTNVYRSLWLLARGADGQLARSLLAEGGMPSVMWAGEPGPATGRRRRPVRMVLGVEVDDLSYAPTAPPRSPDLPPARRNRGRRLRRSPR
jgi:hypothetical protein